MACKHFDNNRCGACCLLDWTCVDDVTRLTCPETLMGEEFKGEGSVCLGPVAGENSGGPDRLCADVIPTVSEWGLVVLTLLLLTVGKLYFGYRRSVRTRRPSLP